MTNEIKKYCEGLDCAICDEKEPCIYKIANELEEQLSAKEQECEELKEKFQDMKKSRDIALKEYNEEFEYKRQITVEHLEQKKELLKQLDQLKAENEELKKQLMQKSEIDMFFNTPLEGWSSNPCDICQYKQTLTEIKEIAEKRNYLDYNECLDDILQKISEVEE